VPDTLVNDELSPPVINIHPSLSPMATEYDYNTRFFGTSFLFHYSLEKSNWRIRSWLFESPKK